MTYNLTELVTLRAWARNSDNFDLRFWAAKGECGTTLCLAGKAVVGAGYEFVWKDKQQGVLWHAQLCTDPTTGTTYDIPEVGRDVLGLTPTEGDQLFTPCLHDAAMEATGAREDGDVCTSDLESVMALDFLDLLIKRSEYGKDHMDEQDIRAWVQQWEGEHWDELMEATV